MQPSMQDNLRKIRTGPAGKSEAQSKKEVHHAWKITDNVLPKTAFFREKNRKRALDFGRTSGDAESLEQKTPP